MKIWVNEIYSRTILSWATFDGINSLQAELPEGVEGLFGEIIRWTVLFEF